MHRFVLHHPEEGVLPAGAWVLAELVVARVHVAALVVRCAPSQVGGQRLTAANVVAHVAVRTGADHGPDRYRVNDQAGGQTGL